MSDPDFSGVDPLRVPEARRRVAVLERYLALPRPSTADAVRFGKEIGLSRWQFQRLAAVWRDHRNPQLIVVGQRGPSSRDYGLAHRAIEIADEEIDAGKHAGTIAAIAATIERRCAQEGVAPPSRPTIYSYVRRARAAGAASGDPRLVLGRMWFHMPIEGVPAGTMPTLIVAVLLPERTIIAHRMSTDPLQPPSISQVVDEVARLRDDLAPARVLVMNDDDRRAAEGALRNAGLESVRGQRQAAQIDLSRSLGGKLGDLDVILKRGSARPGTRRPASRFDLPLPAADVRAAIEAAIEKNNSHATMPPPTFDIARP